MIAKAAAMDQIYEKPEGCAVSGEKYMHSIIFSSSPTWTSFLFIIKTLSPSNIHIFSEIRWTLPKILKQLKRKDVLQQL